MKEANLKLELISRFDLRELVELLPVVVWVLLVDILKVALLVGTVSFLRPHVISLFVVESLLDSVLVTQGLHRQLGLSRN